MPKFWMRVLGIMLGIGILKLTHFQSLEYYLVCLPVLFIAPLRHFYPNMGLGFLITYNGGLFIGKYFLNYYPNSWIWPDILVIFVLFFLTDHLNARFKKTKLEIEERNESIQKEYEDYSEKTKDLKKKNLLIEKNLRDIERLYDLIKEAGNTLNVQEMIDLARDFIGRIFDLPHFLIAVLSDDNSKYEIRSFWGCDESFLKSFNLSMETGTLGSILSKRRKPFWISEVGNTPLFSSLKPLSIRSFIFLPFLMHDRTIGFLVSFSPDEFLLNEEKFLNLQTFCSQVSIGLQKSLLYEKVQRLSIIDGLTKLYSHRHFRQRLEEELLLAKRYSAALSLLIFDIDHFKRYNDTYGHVAGDYVLMEVGQLLKNSTRTSHFLARYGGEEMVLIAPETSKAQAAVIAENIRKTVEAHSFSIGKKSTTVTISIGVASYPEDAQTYLDLINRADTALYAAKNGGRNRVATFPV